ncbi:MAG: hypothetical protein AB7G28_03245 [Pirellulales bacterium]
MSGKGIVLATLLLTAICGESFAQGTSAPVAAQTPTATSPDKIAAAVAQLIADAIPREYERKKDWGRQKEITTGLHSYGNFFKFDMHRTKTAVNHGVWKHYRATLVDPQHNLQVRIDNLRSVAAGRIAFTLFVTTKLHGWGRAKVYDRGVHVIALEAETDAKVSLWLDCEIALEAAPASFLSGIAVRPQITSARMNLDEFRLTRISDVSGPVVRELGDGIKHLIEDELNGPKLAAKLNHSIEKRRDRLVFTPDMLLGATPNK